jgi:hypothetical protein
MQKNSINVGEDSADSSRYNASIQQAGKVESLMLAEIGDFVAGSCLLVWKHTLLLSMVYEVSGSGSHLGHLTSKVEYGKTRSRVSSTHH